MPMTHMMCRVREFEIAAPYTSCFLWWRHGTGHGFWAGPAGRVVRPA